MYYLVIDLEMCMVPARTRSAKYRYSSEIIQMGAVLLDENYQSIATLRQYIHPEYGVIDDSIEKLTGITNLQVKNAPLLQEGLIHLLDWIGDREYKVIAWSNSDFHQFLHEVKRKDLTGDERIDSFMTPDRWIDYQAVFKKRFDMDHIISLKDALICCELETEGKLHDGLDDAINTAQIVRLLENDPEFDIVREYLDDNSNGTLSFSFGELLKGIKIA